MELKVSSILKILLTLYLCLFISLANAGLFSALAKLGKASKTAKVASTVTVAESANLAFSKLGTSGKKLGMYIDAADNGQLKIISSQGDEILLPSGQSNIAQVIQQAQNTALLKHTQYSQNKVEWFVPESLFFKNKDSFDSLKNIDKLTLVRPNGNHLNTKFITTATGSANAIDVGGNIFLNVKSSFRLENMLWGLHQPLKNPKIITLFDHQHITAFQKFSKNFEKKRITAQDFLAKDINQSMQSLKGQTVFVLGKIENGYFVIKDSKLSKQRIPVEQLNALAKEHQISLNMISTQAVKHLNKLPVAHVKELTLVQKLEDLANANNLRSVYQQISQPDAPMVLSDIKVTSTNISATSNIASPTIDGIHAAWFFSHSYLLMPSKEYEDEMNDRIISFISTDIQIIYLGFWILGIFFIGSAFRWLASVWEIPQRQSGQYLPWFFLGLSRLIVLVFILPYYIFFMILVMPFVWTYRLIKAVVLSIKKAINWIVSKFQTS
jgi:hypothetical protein